MLRQDLIPGMNAILALSVKQPWASLLVVGLKTAETRTWFPRRDGAPIRESVLICASKEPAFSIHQLPQNLANRLALAWWDRPLRPTDELPNSVALGTVDLVDDRVMTLADEPAACCAVYPRAVAWICANARRIKPFAVRGALGFFPVPIANARVLERL